MLLGLVMAEYCDVGRAVRCSTVMVKLVWNI